MLVSATAGLEAYLSGTRTILFDYYGYNTSMFYDNNLNVVFRDYKKMWLSIKNFFENNYELNNLGDWSNIIDEIDVYKNGKSSYRLSSLIEEIFLNSLENKNKDENLLNVIEKCNNLFNPDSIYIKQIKKKTK